MNAELAFSQPSENFFQPNVGFMSFMACNNSLTRMVVTTDGYNPIYGQIYYYTRANVSDPWSNKIQILGIPVSNMRWTSVAMSADGSKLVVIGYNIPAYTFKWINGAYVFQGTITNPVGYLSFAGLNMSSDGSRIVMSNVSGYVYYSTWNNSTNNYNELVQTLDTTPRNLSNNQYANLAMSANGNRIAFCDYNAQNVPSFIFADWNGSNYGQFIAISELTSNKLALCGGGAFSPDGGCLIINAQQPMYGYFNSTVGNFTGFINVPSNIMPPLYGLYYINIFSITHDGSHLFWNLNRDDMTIKMVTLEFITPTLYLGDKVIVHNLDVNFYDANVFVKDPTAGLHIANKEYVDAVVDATNTLILSNVSTDTVSTSEYNNLIAERQLVQSDLATQINNLYQYFFNASRTEAVLFGPKFLNPLSINGCYLWMDGADSASITKSGNYITRWADKSRKGYHFTQSNTSHSPTFLTNSLNNNSVISFSSSSQTYLGGLTGFDFGTNSYSLFAVCKFNSVNSFGGIFSRSKYGGQQGRIVMSVGGGNYSAGIYHSTVSTMETSISSLDNYVIFELLVNRIQGKDSIFINGTKKNEQSYTPDNTISYTASAANNMIIGGYNNSTGGITPPQDGCYLDGYIAEIVAYSRPTDMIDDERQQVEGYLASKWGLTSYLPTDHPYIA